MLSLKMSRLKFERLRRGLSQQALGRLAQIAGPDISKIERGIQQPYPNQRTRLAAVIGISPEALLSETIPLDIAES